jgi:hypothetical protein
MSLLVTDVLLVSLGTTGGLRAADAALAGALRRAGASVAEARVPPVREVRTLVLTDLAQALAARRAAAAAIARRRPRAVLYSTTTAALLAPAPGAIRFDAPAAANRPGRHGLWQRPAERRRLARAPLLVPWSDGGLAEARAGATPALVVPVPVAAGGPAGGRDVAVVTYGANPAKKGLDVVLAAWRAARRQGETLVVAGLAGRDEEGVRYAGVLEPAAYRALLRRARVFAAAPRREDYGLAQLEALADGCVLVTTAAPGPYAALPLARALDPRLVVAGGGVEPRDVRPGGAAPRDGGRLAAALRTALDDPAPGYAEHAHTLLAPWRPEAVDRLVADQLLPRLLA